MWRFTGWQGPPAGHPVCRSRAGRRRPSVEGLEGRCLPAGVFNFFATDELPQSITAGPDGNLWFTENAGSVKGPPLIGRITTSGAVTTFPVPADLQGVNAITPGPDGALWFTATVDDKIGRITTGGQVTEFPLPAGAEPQQITKGPDGNLWFTEFQRNMIGTITTGGAVTEFPLPGPSDGQANGITAGPDGNVWFTLPGNSTSHVGRITPGGAVSLFPVPPPPAINASQPRPERITRGPDGNLWFTDSLDMGVGRVTPVGVVTEFFNGFSGEPDAITTGSDGNLWVTTLSIDTVSRVTQAGVVTVFTLRGASTNFKFGGNPLLPVSITAGPDGNIWFIEAPPFTQFGQIGEVVLKNLVPPPPAPPVVTIARPGTAHAGSVFRTTGAFVSRAAGPFAAAVNYGDGSGLKPLATRADRTFSLAHVYASPGTYVVTAGVKDRTGQVGRVSLRVTVSPPAPSGFGPGRDGFVTGLYRDDLGRLPERDGLRFWSGALASGADPEAVATAIYQAPEHRAATALGLVTTIPFERTYADALRAGRLAARSNDAPPGL